MIVYGDHHRWRDVRAALAELGDAVRRLPARPPGLERHAAVVAAFLDASELAQGIADADLAAIGVDARSSAGDAAMELLVAAAGAVAVSWTSGFQRLAPPLGPAVARLAAHPLPERVDVSSPEGYVCYALYPEAYLAAAIAAATRAPGPRRVIGIRSIGAGLAAMVAHATGAPVPTTVRPGGHPFRRRLAVAPALASEWIADPAATVAVADEGPGLSGSSFGAVLDALEERGVGADKVEVFPGHAGDLGPQASPGHRERWGRLRRHVVDLDALILAPVDPAHALGGWVAARVGELDGPLEDVAAGRWRRHHYADERDWPPIWAQQERRKWLARGRGGTWLIKFAGLGRHGDRALDRARRLHAAGVSPEPMGLCHGFLVERWRGDAIPLDRAVRDGALDRTALVARLGRYLGVRARAFPAHPDDGASLPRLLEVARHNAGELLGGDAAAALDRWRRDAGRLAGRVVRVATDSRLHAWEWLVTSDGQLLKTDAVDHCASHDAIGCQDITWDLAGAAVELALTADELARAAVIVAHEARAGVDPALLAMATPCYLAFQAARAAMAADVASEAEGARLRRARDRYVDRLRVALAR